MGLGDCISEQAEQAHILGEKKREEWEFENHPAGTYSPARGCVAPAAACCGLYGLVRFALRSCNGARGRQIAISRHCLPALRFGLPLTAAFPVNAYFVTCRRALRDG